MAGRRTLIGLGALTVTVALLAAAAPDAYASDAGTEAMKRGDFARAAEEWMPLARQGMAEAQFNLGVLHAKGLGVEQDYEQAHRWWLLAARKGEVSALENLGIMYARGDGVAPDAVEAYRWFTLAAAAYPSGERRERMRDARAAVARTLTPQQIERAERLAARWRAQAE